MGGELSKFLQEHKLTCMGYALSACGALTLDEVRSRLGSPKTSYGFCSDLLNKGAHNSDVKLLKSHCKRHDSDIFEAAAPTWNFRLLVPFDPVEPTRAPEAEQSSFEGAPADSEEYLQFSIMMMSFT